MRSLLERLFFYSVYEIYYFLFLLHNKFIIEFTLFSNESDLGNVCQDMWNSAVDNLKIGQEIVIYTGSKPDPLITLTNLGKKKLQRSIFMRFKGNVSLV